MAEAARQNSGLSTSCFPSSVLPSVPVWLVGRGMLPWKQSWSGQLPPREAECRESKNPRAKSRSQPAPGPKNFPLELLSSCAYSGPVLCRCCCSFQAVGTLQALFPVPRPPGAHPPSVMGWTLPKKVTSEQPTLSAEETIFHHRETISHPLAMDVNEESHPWSSAGLCRILG